MNFLEENFPFGSESDAKESVSSVRSWPLRHAYATTATGDWNAQTPALAELRTHVTTTECVMSSRESVNVMLITMERRTVANVLQGGMALIVPWLLYHST